jgi:uncharacterized damage-inducible protein DinB
MSRTAHFRLLAQYNDWMNQKLYEAAATLPEQERQAERGAFFGSLHMTLQHIAVADVIWLRRFGAHPHFASVLAEVMALPQPADARGEPMSWQALRVRRAWLDRQIMHWTCALSEADLDLVIHYKSLAGVPGSRCLGGLVTHFFNHQTHHRGQATTLLFQQGIDVGVTDLVALIPEHGT